MRITYKMVATITAGDLFRLLNIPCNPCDMRVSWREITITPLEDAPLSVSNRSISQLDSELLRVELSTYKASLLPERKKGT